MKNINKELEIKIIDWLVINNAVRIANNNGDLKDFTQKSIRELTKEIINLTS